MAMNVTMPYSKFKQMDEKTLDIVRNAAEKKVDPTDRMILDDIGDRDHDNHELVLKKCKEYRFEISDSTGPQQAKQQAEAFAAQAMRRALLKMGITALEKHVPGTTRARMTGRMIDRQMAKKDVKLEYRKPSLYSKEDVWRSGWYIYHGNEIAYHCSNPMLMRGTGGRIIIASARYFLVRTNAPEPKKGEKR